MTVRQITPFLHVPDMDAALEFFCRTLPFELKVRHSNYAYIELAGAGLRMLEEPARRLTPDGKARVTLYVDVKDVDALFADLRPRLEKLPEGSWYPPQEQTWDQREFQVRLPDGDWMTVGQPSHPQRQSRSHETF